MIKNRIFLATLLYVAVKNLFFYHYFYKPYLMLLNEKGYSLAFYSPVRRDGGATCLAGSTVPRARAERRERVRQQERVCECITTSVCVSASARAKLIKINYSVNLKRYEK